MNPNRAKASIFLPLAVLGLCSAAVLLSACVEKTTALTAAERERVSQFVTDTEPSPQHVLDVSFEDKILLLGYDLSSDSMEAGSAFTITWHYKVERAVDEGWRLFTHVADANDEVRLNADGGSAVRDLYQPGRWKAGEYVRDEQTINLPDDWNSSRATFYVGIYKDAHRLGVTRGPNDGDNRVRAVSLPVGGGTAAEAPAQRPTPAAEPNLPAVTAQKVSTPPRIDGRLDDAAWGEARATSPFVNTMNGSAAQPNATAKVLWDDRNLYVGFEVADTLLKSSFTNRDDHLWEQDCVEIMIDPGGDAQNYFEMQVSPQGVVFDTRYDRPRNPQPFGHVTWDSHMTTRVTRRGTSNDDTADEGYTVEIAIPWTAFNEGTPPAERPAPNSSWRINFFVMDSREEGQQQRTVGWSPPRVGDFHTLNRFGRIDFNDPAARPAPGVPPGGANPIAPAVPAELLKQLRRQLPGRDRPGPGEVVPTRENPTGM